MAKRVRLSWIRKTFICIVTLNVLSIHSQELFKSIGIFENVCQTCRISNFVLGTKKVTSLFQCIQKCVKNTNCESINYKSKFNGDEQKAGSNDHNCELLGVTLINGGKKDTNGDWEHHEPIYLVSSFFLVFFNVPRYNKTTVSFKDFIAAVVGKFKRSH